jgi:predicted dehydrogenase
VLPQQLRKRPNQSFQSNRPRETRLSSIMSKVIHVGLIGLSADTSQGTTWAASAHLPYFLKSPKYEIVALQNSTAEKAQKAIEHYSLPGDVQAYGTPEGLLLSTGLTLDADC